MTSSWKHGCHPILAELMTHSSDDESVAGGCTAASSTADALATEVATAASSPAGALATEVATAAGSNNDWCILVPSSAGPLPDAPAGLPPAADALTDASSEPATPDAPSEPATAAAAAASCSTRACSSHGANYEDASLIQALGAEWAQPTGYTHDNEGPSLLQMLDSSWFQPEPEHHPTLPRAPPQPPEPPAMAPCMDVIILGNAISVEKHKVTAKRLDNKIGWQLHEKDADVLSYLKQLVLIGARFYVGITCSPSWRWTGGETPHGNRVMGHWNHLWSNMTVVAARIGYIEGTFLESFLTKWAMAAAPKQCANQRQGGAGIAFGSDVYFVYILTGRYSSHDIGRQPAGCIT